MPINKYKYLYNEYNAIQLKAIGNSYYQIYFMLVVVIK